MKKIIAISLLICLTVTPLFNTALAQAPGEPAFVSPIDGTYFEVSQGQEVILWMGWIACTRGQVTAFLTSAQLDWKFDGAPLLSSDEDVADFWLPMQTNQPYSECVSPIGDRQTWVAYWVYPIGSFDEVGTHTVDLEIWLDHPVTDGFDGNGDRRPDLYRGSFGLLSADIAVVP
jgi:hypothetical protein